MTLVGELKLADVQHVEQLAFHAWPGLEVDDLHGWQLRHAAGVTRRANSVWPNRLRAAVEVTRLFGTVEDFYHARQLPARYQICPAMLPADLDDMLAARGYRATARTAVQTTRVADLCARLTGAEVDAVQVHAVAPEAWWACYAGVEAETAASIAARQRICARVQGPIAYASLVQDGETMAVGSAVVEAGWIGFFNIATRQQFRRRGAARAVLAALARWGAADGATDAYLQVMADNEAALHLYARLGFRTGYNYHYREEVPADR